MKPFVKWAGGKTQLLNKLVALMPKKFNTYFEPFLGGGALFLKVAPKKAIVSDYNKELIAAFNVFKDKQKYNEMITNLILHENKHSEDYYYTIRNLDKAEEYKDFSDAIIAARFIYLNKAGFNGLYRVNSKGYFNVPSGKKDIVKVFNYNLFKKLHEYLKTPNIKILMEDFELITNQATKGDFVYFDPPYDVPENSRSFTAYTKEGFNQDEQIRLAKVFKKLTNKGVYVMLSNRNTKFIRELYKDFNIKVVEAKRSINSKGAGRGVVEEVIITNY